MLITLLLLPPREFSMLKALLLLTTTCLWEFFMLKALLPTHLIQCSNISTPTQENRVP